ncbi:MAG: ATP synthase F1 subunit gamma [Erysipelotrichaceae bacterium]
MALNKLAIKARIRSIDSTRKITKAMQLVAASKLKRQKENMEKNREYAFYLKETVSSILASMKYSTHPYLVKPSVDHPLNIVFTSDMGLCGGYNANIYRLLTNEFNEKDEIIMIGSRGQAWSKHRDFNVSECIIDIDDDGYNQISKIGDEALERYINGEISEIRIVYTHFKNAVTFIPEMIKLLPVEVGEEQKVSRETIFEPQGDQILDDLVPMYIRSLLFSYYLETKTSEQASRRTAMESATDNANELVETLELQFNQARQAAITQEITEIVGGANALE